MMQVHTSKDIQANEADVLGVDCFFARVHPEQRVPGLQANVCLSDMCNCEFFAGISYQFHTFLHECQKEAAFLSSVSRYFGVMFEFTIDLGYFSLRSFVGCIGTFMVSVVSGRTRLPSSVVRLLGAASVGRGRRSQHSSLWSDLGVNRGLPRLRVTPTMRRRGGFEHSTCASLVRVM